MQGQKPPTASEQRRLNDISHLWCLPCAMDGWDGVLATVQHVVEGRKRLGHHFTWPGCEWHHLGIPPEGFNIHEATARWGPSLAHHHRRFQATFASERSLVSLTDYLLSRKKDLTNCGQIMTAEQYGTWVRHEAVLRFGRAVAVGR